MAQFICPFACSNVSMLRKKEKKVVVVFLPCERGGPRVSRPLSRAVMYVLLPISNATLPLMSSKFLISHQPPVLDQEQTEK